jgi:hypothetical protein
MVMIGSAILALIDARNWIYEDAGVERLALVGWALIFGSAFAVRHLGRWLWLYIPGVWLASAVTVTSLVVPVGNAFSLIYLTGECGEVNRYLDKTEESSGELNDRIALFQEFTNGAGVNEAIQDTRAEVVRFEDMEDVPSKVEALHQERIDLYAGWVGVFEAHRDGRLTEDTLYELQEVDDEFGRLFDEAALDCS